MGMCECGEKRNRIRSDWKRKPAPRELKGEEPERCVVKEKPLGDRGFFYKVTTGCGLSAEPDRDSSTVVSEPTIRITVLVQDRRGERYSDGKHYSKFYVPVQMLESVE